MQSGQEGQCVSTRNREHRRQCRSRGGRVERAVCEQKGQEHREKCACKGQEQRGQCESRNGRRDREQSG